MNSNLEIYFCPGEDVNSRPMYLQSCWLTTGLSHPSCKVESILMA